MRELMEWDDPTYGAGREEKVIFGTLNEEIEEFAYVHNIPEILHFFLQGIAQ